MLLGALNEVMLPGDTIKDTATGESLKAGTYQASHRPNCDSLSCVLTQCDTTLRHCRTIQKSKIKIYS